MKVIDYINFSGTIASLIGLIIVIYQIMKLKGIAEASKDASEKTRARITELLFAMDIPKALKVVQEIQHYNRSSKFELSILRMQDLKYHLIQVKNNGKYDVDKQHYVEFITDLSIDLSNIEKEIKNKTKSIDIVRLNSTLDKILNYLSDIDTTVKSEGVK